MKLLDLGEREEGSEQSRFLQSEGINVLQGMFGTHMWQHSNAFARLMSCSSEVKPPELLRRFDKTTSVNEDVFI